MVLAHNVKLDIRKIWYKGHGHYLGSELDFGVQMVHTCCVPDCFSRSDREVNLSYYGLPLTKKGLLRQWVHKIGRSSLPLNDSATVCSHYFVKTEGRKLRKDKAPSENLPVLSTTSKEAETT